jgi:hypothetical protein
LWRLCASGGGERGAAVKLRRVLQGGALQTDNAIEMKVISIIIIIIIIVVIMRTAVKLRRVLPGGVLQTWGLGARFRVGWAGGGGGG